MLKVSGWVGKLIERTATSQLGEPTNEKEGSRREEITGAEIHQQRKPPPRAQAREGKGEAGTQARQAAEERDH